MSSDADKQKNMTEAATRLKTMIETRMAARADTLDTLKTIGTMDGVPESIQKMREDESAKIRMVMQEQQDIISIIKLIFPDA